MSSALWEEGVGEEGSPFPLRACPHVLLPAFHSHNQRARQTQGQLAACALSRDLWSVWIVIFCLDNSKLIVLLWPHKYQSSEPNILWLHFPFSITFYFSWSSSCSLSFFFHLFFVLWISDCLPTPSQKLFKTPFKFSTYSGLSDNLSVLFFSLTMLPGALCPAHMSPGPSPSSWHTSAILGVLSVFAADVPALFSLLDSLFVSWIPCLPLSWFTPSFRRTSVVAQTVKCLPAMQETRVQSLGQEDPLEKEMATHSSILGWKIPWSEEPDRLQSMGSQRVGHD